MKIFLWVLCAYGLTQIIVESSAFNSIKRFIKDTWFHFLYELTSCVLCTSVWVGFLFGAFFYSPVQTEFQLSNFWISIFLDGMLSSAVVWFLHLLEVKISK